MATRIKIVELTKIPQRVDVMALVDFEEGDLIAGCDDYVRVGSSDVWRITSIGTHPHHLAGLSGKQRLPIGLASQDAECELTIGDVLECIESRSCSDPDS